MTRIRKCSVLVGLCIVCIAASLGLNQCRREIEKWGDRRLVQKKFASIAEDLRKGLLRATKLTPQERQRREAAISILSNGVLDPQVIILTAKVSLSSDRPSADSKTRTGVFLDWYAVDELTQVDWVGYDDSDDPNAFGHKLFTISDYYSTVRYAESPKFFWTIPLAPDRATQQAPTPKRGLMGSGYGLSPRWWLQVSVGEWNSLVLNRGQLILRDSNLKELHRLELSPPTNEDTHATLKTLMLPDPNTAGDPNSTLRSTLDFSN